MPTTQKSSSAGDPANPSPAFLGVDVGGHSTKLALLLPPTEPANTNPPGFFTATTAHYADPDSLQLQGHIAAALVSIDTQTLLRVRAVAFCLPGLLDEAGRRLVHATNLPRMAGLSLPDLAAELLGHAVPTTATSDAVACCLDVAATHGLTGRTFGLVLGTGVGAAVLDDGLPLRVDGDSPGHFGQLDVSLDADAPLGPDGGRGSLEAYLGAPALERRLGRDLAAALPRLPHDDPAVAALARAVRIGHALYRPHHVVLAGGIGIRLAPVLSAVEARIRDRLTNLARPGWTLRCATDDHHAARGAARMAARGAARMAAGL
ncbi:MAG: ROK family protein [Phycisphaerae bacterium]